MRYIERQRDNYDKTLKIFIYLINPSCSRRASYFQNGQQMVAIMGIVTEILGQYISIISKFWSILLNIDRRDCQFKKYCKFGNILSWIWLFHSISYFQYFSKKLINDDFTVWNTTTLCKFLHFNKFKRMFWKLFDKENKIAIFTQHYFLKVNTNIFRKQSMWLYIVSWSCSMHGVKYPFTTWLWSTLDIFEGSAAIGRFFIEIPL